MKVEVSFNWRTGVYRFKEEPIFRPFFISLTLPACQQKENTFFLLSGESVPTFLFSNPNFLRSHCAGSIERGMAREKLSETN